MNPKAAELQKQLRSENPDICWAFVSPDDLCFLLRPCPRHDGMAGPYVELAAKLLSKPEVVKAVAKALEEEGL